MIMCYEDDQSWQAVHFTVKLDVLLHKENPCSLVLTTDQAISDARVQRAVHVSAE